MRVEILLRRLEDEQKTLAIEALSRPQGKDSYDYGRVVGIYAGLEQAKNLILDTMAEKEAKDFLL
jgi:hypothetical protein